MYIRFIDSSFYHYVQVKNSHGLVGYYIENCSFDRTSFQFNGVVCVHMSKNKITSSSEIIVTGISSSGLSWKQFFPLCNFSRYPFIHVENMDFRIEMKTHFSPIVFTRIHTVMIDCIFDIIKSPTSSVELLRIKSPLFHLKVKNMTLNASDLDVDDITLLTMSYKTSEIINLQILCPLELITDLKLLPRIGYKSEEYSCCQMCHVLDGYYWVFSNSSKPMCAPCPFGAKCEYGKIIVLPNYWGYRNKTGFVTMIRCPAGYCCEGKETCLDVDSCGRNRGAILCGTCLGNFAESLLSSKCLPNHDCQPVLILVLYILAVIIYSVCLLVLPFIKDKLIISMSNIFRQVKGKLFHRMNNGHDQSDMETHGILETVIVTESLKAQSDINKKEDGLKYLQILFYYVQDASLFKIQLPDEVANEEGITEKILQFSPDAITYLYKKVSDLCLRMK